MRQKIIINNPVDNEARSRLNWIAYSQSTYGLVGTLATGGAYDTDIGLQFYTGVCQTNYALLTSVLCGFGQWKLARRALIVSSVGELRDPQGKEAMLIKETSLR